MKPENDGFDYKDIIDLPPPELWVRPRMSRYNRAAQFAPFAALSGFEALLRKVEQEVKAAETSVQK